jgi:soluble lytic murein transglycosylase-like protein
MSGFIEGMIVTYSYLIGFNPDVSLAVAQVESNLNPNAIGTKGEIGLYQLMPQFVDKKHNLKDIRTNIYLGISKLKEEQNNCKHKNDLDFLVCYNMGRTGANKIKHPSKFSYVKKVKKQIQKNGKTKIFN